MYPNAESIVSQIQDIVKQHQEFSKYTLDILKPPAGPYALFHHHGLFVERIQNVSSIIERMGKARFRITVLHEREERLEPKNGIKPGRPFPKYLQKIASEIHTLTGLMRMDNETLYIFGNLSLDQWAYTVGYSLGLAEPGQYTFHQLFSKLQANSVDPKLRLFHERHFKDAIWLYYQLRFYRNNFIEHVSRPWQRGSTMSTYGSDFKFFIPTPPGWIPKEKQEEMFATIQHLTPDWINQLPPDHWQGKPRATLEAMLKHIDDVPRPADREKIWDVWKEIGGSTISFDVLGNRLVKFILESTQILFEEMKNNPKNINLGPSPYKESI
jgi:hypothetical protein